jgi:hypothetical protein
MINVFDIMAYIDNIRFDLSGMKKGCYMGKETFSVKISFLRAGWWLVHILGIAAVYTAGHLLW